MRDAIPERSTDDGQHVNAGLPYGSGHRTANIEWPTAFVVFDLACELAMPTAPSRQAPASAVSFQRTGACSCLPQCTHFLFQLTYTLVLHFEDLAYVVRVESLRDMLRAIHVPRLDREHDRALGLRLVILLPTPSLFPRT
jgi:hypothetical protein